MIRNILKQLWNQRRVNGWILIELFLVFIPLVIICDLLITFHLSYQQPLGFNINNTYLIQLYEKPSNAIDYVSTELSGSNSNEDFANIISRIRNLKYVEEVSATFRAYPYNGSMDGGSYKSYHPNDTITAYGIYKKVSPEFFKVFRIQTSNGQIAGQAHPYQFVISQSLADSLKVNNGDSITVGSSNSYIVEICTHTRRSEYNQYWEEGYEVVPESILLKYNFVPDICIRIQEGLSNEQQQKLWTDIQKACQVNNYSLFYWKSFNEIRKQFITIPTNLNNYSKSFLTFLLVNVFLGIIGTFWYRTQQRRIEIGIRMAMGANKQSIFIQLILEGIILLSISALPAIIVNINNWKLELIIISEGTIATHFYAITATFCMLAMTIILGIWYPARQAMRVNPADVLHEE